MILVYYLWLGCWERNGKAQFNVVGRLPNSPLWENFQGHVNNSISKHNFSPAGLIIRRNDTDSSMIYVL